MRFVIFIAQTVSIAGLAPPLRAEEGIDYARDILPILSDHCFPCHGPDDAERKADLRLDTREGLFDPRDDGAPFVPHSIEQSHALDRILASDPDDQMPPQDFIPQLDSAQKQRLSDWVLAGAPWNQHWSIRPVERPTVPDPSDMAPWGRGPIDSFVYNRIQEAGLNPSPPASPSELVRRVALDLTGLPPSRDLADAFLENPSDAAYERLVDRLLKSPRFGERWAWEWLDAARYADSNGYQADRERTMWPWRDWVIQAMNDNMPFDEFTLRQLAGDLLPNPTRDQVLATGFLRNHMINGEGGRIPEENRVDYVMDMTETVGSVWLGLTLNCCRCHDHKYDPIPQSDYYRFSAFFNQTPVTGAGGDPQTPPVIAVPSETQEEESRRVQAALDRVAFRTSELEQHLFAEAQIDAPDAEEFSKFLETRPANRKSSDIEERAETLSEAYPEYARQLIELRQAIDFRNAIRNRIPKVMVMRDRAEPRETYVLERGLYNQPRETVRANTPTFLPPMEPEAPRNRLGLARWILSENNPLTSRVVVNQIWQRLFGAGIVRTPGDFGSQGQRPTHPDLLDWLASEFVEQGWNVKALIKEIALSATYRQSSRTTPERLELDPDNRWLSRAPRHRLPSWILRDQALEVSGLLSDRIGGAPVNGYQPDGVWSDVTFGRKKYAQDNGEKLYRRSVYTFWRRIIGPTVFFDVAKRQTCELNPKLTNTPLHALVTLNDITYNEAARVLAERALKATDAEPHRNAIEFAFESALVRRPTPEEERILSDRYQALTRSFRQTPENARRFINVGESKPDKDVEPAKLAALSVVCGTLLNLDECLTRQ